MSEIHNATGGNADAPSTAPRRDCAHGRLARSCEICECANEIADLRAQLAQRDEELEALRELAKNVIDAQDAAMQHPITEGKVRVSMNAVAALRAALSDNSESPALTDKEA